MDELIRKSDARRAVLIANPAVAYCIESIKPVSDYRKVVKGKWQYWARGLVSCPICGHEYTDYLECDNFCGNCGADMRDTADE